MRFVYLVCLCVCSLAHGASFEELPKEGKYTLYYGPGESLDPATVANAFTQGGMNPQNIYHIEVCSDAPLTLEEWDSFELSLPTLQNLQSLYLSEMAIADSVIPRIFQAIRQRGIRALYIHDSPYVNSVDLALELAKETPSLSTFGLTGIASLEMDDIIFLTAGIRANTSLTGFDFSGSSFGSLGCYNLLQALIARNTPDVTVNMAWNGICWLAADQGQALFDCAEIIGLNSLNGHAISINLSENTISDPMEAKDPVPPAEGASFGAMFWHDAMESVYADTWYAHYLSTGSFPLLPQEAPPQHHQMRALLAQTFPAPPAIPPEGVSQGGAQAMEQEEDDDEPMHPRHQGLSSPFSRMRFG